MLAPEAPYPLAGGGALRTASLLHGLARHYDVDLILFRQPADPDLRAALPRGLVNRIEIIYLPENRRTASARLLRNTVRLVRQVPPLVDRFSGFERQVAAALKGERYDLGIIEHFWCAPYWEQIAPVCRRTILNLHNVESVLHERCAGVEKGATAFAHGVFARVAAEMEAHWLPRFSHIFTASCSDQASIWTRSGNAEVCIFPNTIPLPPAVAVERRHAIVFSGNLEYHPNISAVRFFRQHVWPRVRERWPALVWRVLGRNPMAVERWTQGDPRIEVAGAVEDAISELARAEVAIVPLLAGSGTRLKILEAWAAGLPVVSTTLGAEGFPVRDGNHLLLADTAEAFAEAISRLLRDPDLGRELAAEGRALLEREFTWEKAWQTLDCALAPISQTLPLSNSQG
ncbi:MAG: glycosyltransferase [Acidobacteriia bacterium]|nr:glycosyltransferase [Terriglobia bacterium]